jgi:hypothetical protein
MISRKTSIRLVAAGDRVGDLVQGAGELAGGVHVAELVIVGEPAELRHLQQALVDDGLVQAAESAADVEFQQLERGAVEIQVRARVTGWARPGVPAHQLGAPVIDAQGGTVLAQVAVEEPLRQGDQQVDELLQVRGEAGQRLRLGEPGPVGEPVLVHLAEAGRQRRPADRVAQSAVGVLALLQILPGHGIDHAEPLIGRLAAAGNTTNASRARQHFRVQPNPRGLIISALLNNRCRYFH